MAVTLDCYLVDLAEVYTFVNQNKFQELCSIEGDTYTAALSGSRQDRGYRALNWGKSQIDAMLMNVYDVPFTNSQSVSETWPNIVVKSWNVTLATIFLYDNFHIDRRDDGALLLERLMANINEYTRSDGLELLGHERSAQPATSIINGKMRTGTPFDRAGYWPNSIIPDDQTGNLF